MKKSTIALISAFVLLALHGAYLFFGFPGLLGGFLVLGVGYCVARFLYWRMLRQIHASTRHLPSEERQEVFMHAGLDAEARADLARLHLDEKN